MSLDFKVPRVRNLDQWLEVVTDELTMPAKKRIRMEIETHYAEAVASHMADPNASKAIAEMAALAELGDAGSAAKKFRKQYLTESEASAFEKAIKATRSWYRLVLICSILCFLLFYDYQRNNNASIFILVVPVLVGFVAQFILARYRNGKSNIRLFSLVTLILTSLVFVNMLLAQIGYSAMLAFVFINLTDKSWLWWRALYKSLRWEQKLPEMPPQDTAFS